MEGIFIGAIMLAGYIWIVISDKGGPDEGLV